MTTRATPPQKGADMTMTDEPEVADDELEDARVPHYVADPDDEDALEPPDPDEFQFTLGRPGDPESVEDGARILFGRKPKTWVLMKMAQVDPKTKDMAVIAGVVDTFVDHVLDKPSRTYLLEKFLDPDSDWDIDMLVPVIHACKARWYGTRPTGRATGSSGSPGSGGTRSTGRSSSRGRQTRKR